MREYRFRAWDNVLKFMLYGDNIENDDDYHCVLSYGKLIIAYQNKGSDWNELEVMQYTGLKDKNGKGIYEGDIVRICRKYGYGFLPKGSVAIVKWDNKELCYKLYKTGEYRLTENKIVEVIGNIYENPELLEE